MIEELSTSDKHSHRTTRSGGTGEGKDKGKDKDSVYSNSDSGKKTKTKCECECAGESESQIQSQSEIGEIMKRIKAEQCPYVGIYKPGELGRGTWRVVIPSTRRQKGRGHKGRWESVVLSSEGRGRVNILIERIEELAIVDDTGAEKGRGDRVVGVGVARTGVRGVRHILNPQCDQDEGLRIVWSAPISGSDSEMEMEMEMNDWERRDQMRKEGKTVRAVPPAPVIFKHTLFRCEDGEVGQGTGTGQLRWESEVQGGDMVHRGVGRLQHWDNTAWKTLSPT